MEYLTRQDYEYLLGAYLGDGNKYNNFGIRYTVSHKDSDYADVLMELLKPHNPISKIEKSDKYTVFRIVCGWEKTPLNQWFHPYMEDGFWNLPEIRYPGHFLAGLYDTDGSARKRKNFKTATHEIVLYSTHRENLELLLDLHAQVDLYPTLARHDKKMWILRITHWTQTKIFEKNVPLRHPRKRAIVATAGDRVKFFQPVDDIVWPRVKARESGRNDQAAA